jgi:hypothetical protein
MHGVSMVSEEIVIDTLRFYIYEERERDGGALIIIIIISFGMFSSAYLFFYIPEDSNLMRFPLCSCFFT